MEHLEEQKKNIETKQKREDWIKVIEAINNYSERHGDIVVESEFKRFGTLDIYYDKQGILFI